jgi:hypothetical protein
VYGVKFPALVRNTLASPLEITFVETAEEDPMPALLKLMQSPDRFSIKIELLDRLGAVTAEREYHECRIAQVQESSLDYRSNGICTVTAWFSFDTMVLQTGTGTAHFDPNHVLACSSPTE